jgi:hypothetical protein
MPGSDQILNLAAEQPRPQGPVRLGGPVLELARIDRRMISSCVNPNSARAVLSLSVAPSRTHSLP